MCIDFDSTVVFSLCPKSRITNPIISAYTLRKEERLLKKLMQRTDVLFKEKTFSQELLRRYFVKTIVDVGGGLSKFDISQNRAPLRIKSSYGVKKMLK